MLSQCVKKMRFTDHTEKIKNDLQKVTAAIHMYSMYGSSESAKKH
jgi:hypothetical protein